MNEKNREARLRWVGHVEKKTEEDVAMRTWKWVRIPKLRWSDVIKKDAKEKGVKIEEAQYLITCRINTRCADPNMENAEEEVQLHYVVSPGALN